MDMGNVAVNMGEASVPPWSGPGMPAALRSVRMAAGWLSVAASLAGAGAPVAPVIRLSLGSGEHKGVASVRYTRAGPATYFDSERDRIVDASADQMRRERWPGHPLRQGVGVLMETEATNCLTNSSFEDGTAGWSASGGFRAEPTEEGLHGTRGLRLNGKGRFGHVPVPVPDEPEPGFGCLSVYLRGGAEETRKVRLWVSALDEAGRGPNLVRECRFVERPDSRWVRLVGTFGVPRPGLRYEAGLSTVRPVDGVVADAAQLEVGRFPWRVSSYVPTGDGPAKRGKDRLEVKTPAFPLAAGSVLVWFRCSNPYGRTGFIAMHGPIRDGSRVYVGGEGGCLGQTLVKLRRQFQHLSAPAAGWHSPALTWAEGRGTAYLDGEENSVHEGAFDCEPIREYAGGFLIGGDSPRYLGPEGLIEQVEVYDVALSGEQLQARIRPGAAAVSDPVPGLPVSYTVPAAGRVSVGIYDAEERLCRQLVLGEQREPGEYTTPWDGRDDAGRLLPAGSYGVRGVVNSLRSEWRLSIGNSGDPPWGDTKVRGGLFRMVAACGPNIVAGNPTLEGNRGVQMYAPDGRVLWTSEYDPVYGDMTALTCDARFVYVVGLVRNEKNARGGAVYREVLWRLDARNGKVVPWPDGSKAKRLNESREAGEGRTLWHRAMTGESRYTDPFRYLDVADIELLGDRLYVPFRREDLIRVVDRATGEVLAELGGIKAPLGLAVTPDSLWVSSDGAVVCLTHGGRRTAAFSAGLQAPHDVEVTPDGEIAVTDLGTSQQVKFYSRDGVLSRSLGAPFSAVKDGRLDRLLFPTGLAFDAAGRTVVADMGNGRLVYYDAEGELVRRVNAHGFGGIDGGVSFVPGDPGRLYTSNVNIRLPWCSHGIVAYEVDWEAGTWRVARRWPDITPVFAKETLIARRLPNGRLYLFLLTRLPCVYEVDAAGTLTLCSVILHPQRYPIKRGGLRRPHIHREAQELGLLNEDGYWRCRMVWTDADRDGHMAKGEVRLLEEATDELYSVNDAEVDGRGNLYLGDLFTHTIVRFEMTGFDAVGNPVYDWGATRTVVDLREHPRLVGKGWLTYAKEVDDEGNVYLSQLKGNGCVPDDLRLLKLDADNRVLWQVGRKAAGLKDRPGEFSSVSHIPYVGDGIVYFLEYEGTVDLYTTDGLYLTTFLEAGNQGEPGPASNWGENFFGDVVKDPKTGRVFFVINTHNYVLPGFEVLGLDTVRRFDGQVTMSAKVRERLDARTAVREEFENVSHIYLAPRGMSPDGRLGDWAGIPVLTRALPDQEDTHFVRYRAVADDSALHLAFSIGDPTPGVNGLTDKATLWDGDCLELYASRRLGSRTWQKGDSIIHVALVEDPAKPHVGLLDRATNQWRVPGEITAVTRRWENGSGSDLEVRVPLDALGIESLRLGDRISLDWDVVYSNPEGRAGFKLFRSPDETNMIIRDPARWGPARLVAAAGEERTVYAGRWRGDWGGHHVQAELPVPDTEGRYGATLKAAADDAALRFRVEVKDPDPAICTPSDRWLGTGDFCELFVERRHVYVVCSLAYEDVFLMQGGQAVKLAGASRRLEVKKDAYVLEADVPWAALGDRKDTYSLNWRMGWSDKTGGSAFTRRALCAEGETVTLRLVGE